jgi:hypothetical protein
VVSWSSHPNEKVLVVGRPGIAVVWPKYLLTAGLYGLWHKRNVAVLTDQRVFLGKGLLSRSERSIPLRRVRRASYSRHGLAGYCDLSERTANTWEHSSTRIGPLRARTARRLVNEVENRI